VRAGALALTAVLLVATFVPAVALYRDELMLAAAAIAVAGIFSTSTPRSAALVEVVAQKSTDLD